jgi:hypothetical protein
MKVLTKNLQKYARRKHLDWDMEYMEWPEDGIWGYPYDDFDVFWLLYHHPNSVDLLRAAKAHGMKVIDMFVGTDILWLKSRPPYEWATHVASADLVLADAPHLVDELKEVNIDAMILRTVPAYNPGPLKLKDKKHVLVYMPTGRHDFYLLPWIVALAERTPEQTYHMVASEGPEMDIACPPNIEWHGFVEGEDKDALWEKCWLNVRFAQHDGIGMTALEMLQRGRLVITNGIDGMNMVEAINPGEAWYWLDSGIKTAVIPNEISAKHWGKSHSKAKQGREAQEVIARLK